MGFKTTPKPICHSFHRRYSLRVPISYGGLGPWRADFYLLVHYLWKEFLGGRMGLRGHTHGRNIHISFLVLGHADVGPSLLLGNHSSMVRRLHKPKTNYYRTSTNYIATMSRFDP